MIDKIWLGLMLPISTLIIGVCWIALVARSRKPMSVNLRGFGVALSIRPCAAECPHNDVHKE